MKRILLLFFAIIGTCYSIHAQSRKVTGKITNQENQQPVSGVSVSVKGTDIGTSTDASGNFSLMVPAKNNTLVISNVGFVTREVAIDNRSVINVSLAIENKALDEVIVTALNINRSARSLGYSVSTVKGDQVDKVQTVSLVSALSGKVAGVDVGNIANGVAGSKRIVIRGGSSLTGNNQPLWIVDGIPINSSTIGESSAGGGIDYGDGLSGINPDNIASISVLKGNAAAALYGSRAANGVIIVTTKSGKSGNGKMQVDVSSSIQFDKVNDVTDYQYEYGQSSQHDSHELPIDADDATGSDSWGHKLDGTPVPQFDGVVRPFVAHKNNYTDFFNTGSTLNNTVSLSGSSVHNNYRISVSDLRNTDIVPKAKFTRTGLDLKTSSKFGNLSADLALNYTYQHSNGRPYVGGNNGNQFYSLVYLPANIDQKILAPGIDTTTGREKIWTQSVSNPYYVVNYEKVEDTRNRLRGGLTLKYDFTKWLYVRGRILRDYYIAKRFRAIPETNMSHSSYPDGHLDQVMRENIESNYEFILGFNPDDFGKFNVNGFVGGNIDWRVINQSVTSGDAFVVPGVYTFNNLAVKLPETNLIKRRTNSLFGSIQLSYNQYLYLTLTGRNDWFSTLPVESNNLFYPSASLSFVFSDALKLPSWITYGKFRASSAQVSGDTDPYQLDLSYSLDQLQFQGLPLQYIGTDNIPNRNLKPLLSTDYEIGLEMGFFNDRLGFDIDYYNKNIRNDIVTTAVSNSTGYETAVLNVGELSDEGIEVLLRGTPVKMKNFSWNAVLTFSTLNNRVVSLGEGTKGANIILARTKGGTGSVQLEEGKRYGGIYGYTYKRDSLGNKIFDSKGLPEYNASQTLIGNSMYNKILGFANTFTYKDFSLYVFFDGKFGGDLYSETNSVLYDIGKHKATLVGREDGLVGDGVGEDGKPNTVLVRGYNSPAGPGASIDTYYKTTRQIGEQFIYKADFLKLREVALSYNFQKSFLQKLNISYATVSLVARNLLTVYKDKNLDNVDPESSVSSGNAQGIDRMGFPPMKSYGFTIKFGF